MIDGLQAVEHVFQDSLDRAITALKQPVDFGQAPRAQFYLDFLAKVQKAFPDEKVWYSYSWEGPVTTAYEFRGDAFFLDVFDEPEKAREFLGRLTGGETNLAWTPTATNVYAIVARVTDAYGVSAISPTKWVRIDNDRDHDGVPDSLDRRPDVPNVPPAIQFVQLASAANLHTEGPITVRVGAVDLDGDPIAYQWLLDGPIIVPFQPSSQFTWQPGPAAVGPHQLVTQAGDGWAPPTQQTTSFYVFRTPPRPQ